MSKAKLFATTTLIAATFGAGAAVAAQNPLQPNYPTYAAALTFASNTGADVAVVASPLQPNFYDRNVATASDGRSVEVVMNNPLQPGFKRS